MLASQSARTRLVVAVALGVIAVGVLLVGVAAAEVTLPMSAQWVQSMGPEPLNRTTVLPLGDRVYVTHDGDLHALDAASGAELWKTKLKDVAVSTSPVGFKDSVIVGLDSGSLLRLKPDGDVIWKKDAGGAVAQDPLVLGDLVIVAAKDLVTAYDANSGESRWTVMLPTAVRYGPLTDGSQLYFLCQDGSVASVDPESKHFRWRTPVPSGSGTIKPTLVDGRVVVPSGKMLYAVARSGAISWTQELPAGIGSPVSVVGNALLVPCLDGQIYSLTTRSGRSQPGTVYRQPSEITAPPLFTPTTVIVGTSDSLVYGMDRATGVVKWTYRCRAPEQFPDDAGAFGIVAPVVESNGSVYVMTGSGDLYCFSSATEDATGPEFTSLLPEPGGDALSSKQFVLASFEVHDDATGLDPSTVTLTLDGKPAKCNFDPRSGVGTLVLQEGQIKEGSHVLKATAKDYRGNENSVEWSFLTDESIEPKEDTTQTGINRTRAGTQGGIRGGANQGGTRGGGNQGGAGRGGAGGGGMRGGMGGGMGR